MILTASLLLSRDGKVVYGVSYVSSTSGNLYDVQTSSGQSIWNYTIGDLLHTVALSRDYNVVKWLFM